MKSNKIIQLASKLANLLKQVSLKDLKRNKKLLNSAKELKEKISDFQSRKKLTDKLNVQS